MRKQKFHSDNVTKSGAFQANNLRVNNLKHHLTIAGVKTTLFTDAALTAIYQGSGGIYRKANNLARGSLIAAAADKASQITPDHVRVASSEIM